MPAVQTGLDVFISRHLASLRGKRVGVLCHQASVDSQLNPIVSLLLDHKVQVTTLFAPEHGLWGTAQDQVPIPSDTRGTSLPIYSLYGDHRAPSPEQLADIDVLIC